MRIIRNEKGITMVSLAITIIIMMTLATVSLNLALGDGTKTGLIEKTKNAIYKSELDDLKEFWETKIVDIDTEYLNYDNLEDVMDIEQIPESLRGVLGVKKGRLYYKDEILKEDKKDIMKEMGIYADYVDPIKVTVKATIKKIKDSTIYRDDSVITMDQTEKFTSLVVDEKMQYYDKNGKLINYELDETEGEVTVNVTAAIVAPTGVTDASGNSIRKPVIDVNGNMKCKQLTQKYTITEIKNGLATNLSYVDGSIVWNIEEDLQNVNISTNIRAKAITALYTSGEMPDKSKDQAVEIIDVEIILPLITYEETE